MDKQNLDGNPLSNALLPSAGGSCKALGGCAVFRNPFSAEPNVIFRQRQDPQMCARSSAPWEDVHLARQADASVVVEPCAWARADEMPVA